MTNQKKAFTLVELLVAMAIIGVLLGLAVFGLASAQRASRDTERKAALQDINIGYQAYYEKNNTYPSNIAITPNLITLSGVAPATAITIPLKGAATSATTFAGPEVKQILTGTTTTADSTNYCLVFETSVNAVPATNPKGYVFCSLLESGNISCSGAGAVKGNTITGCAIPGGASPLAIP